MPIEKMHITPDEIRNPELKDLRQKLTRAKLLGWIQFAGGLILGAILTLVFA